MSSLSRVLLLCSSLINIAIGSHWRYGQISWKLVSGYTVEFTAEIGWRSTFIGSEYFYFGDGSNVVLSNSECSTMTTPCPQDTSSRLYYQKLSDSTDLNNQPATLIKYIFQYTYSSPGPFEYRLSSCCRVGSIIAGSGNGYSLYGDVNMNNGNTGSPVSSISPILQFRLGQTNTFSLNPVDNDGDAVTCRQATSTESGINQAASSYFSVNSATCEVTISESGSSGDKWAAQVFMETSNGDSIPLDFMFEGITASLTPPDCSLISSPDPNTGNFEITANNPLTVDMFATDGDSSTTSLINVNVVSIPNGALVDPTGSVTLGNGVDVEFYWVPTDSQLGSFSASIQIIDENSLTSLCTIPIFVSPASVDTTAPSSYPTYAPTEPTLDPTREPSEEPTEEPRVI